MRVTLILPRCPDRTEDDGNVLFLPPLNLPTIAAITPRDVDVRIVDDRVERVDLGDRPDLVGITCVTETAGRAYELGDAFRARGAKVVLGGYHPTLAPKDALGHADAVLRGEAWGGAWERVLRDAERGRLARVYENIRPADLSGIPPPRLDLLPRTRRYVRGVRMVQASRGCPMRCAFCSPQAVWEGTVRSRPVADVVAEIRASGKRFIAFVDDDIAGSKKYARDLFEALVPLGIYWASQARINLCLDEELLALAGRSGCTALYVGFESISPDTLREVGKHQNVVHQYRRAIDACHRHGICVEGGFVLGFDTERPSVFRETLRFALDSDIDSLDIELLRPVPGTPAYERLDREGRLLTRDWRDWSNLRRALFRPRGMSVAELEAGTAWMLHEAYTWPRVARRFVRSLRWGRWFAPVYLLLQNVSYKKKRADPWKGGWDPASRRTEAAARAAPAEPVSPAA